MDGKEEETGSGHSPGILKVLKNDGQAEESSEDATNSPNQPNEDGDSGHVGRNQLGEGNTVEPDSSSSVIHWQIMEKNIELNMDVESTEKHTFLKDGPLLPEARDVTDYESIIEDLRFLGMWGVHEDGTEGAGETVNSCSSPHELMAVDHDHTDLKEIADDEIVCLRRLEEWGNSAILQPIISEGSDKDQQHTFAEISRTCSQIPIDDSNDHVINEEAPSTDAVSAELGIEDIVRSTSGDGHNRASYHNGSCIYPENSGARYLVPGNGSLLANGESSKFHAVPILSELDMQLPKPNDLRGHQWRLRYTPRYELGTSGFSYEGKLVAGKMHGRGRLTLGDDMQFIEGKWSVNHLIEIKFCQFTFHCESGIMSLFIVKRGRDYLLTVNENNIAARVMLESIDTLDFTMNLKHFKRDFFSKLYVLEILEDEQKNVRHVALRKLESLLKKYFDDNADPVLRATVLVFLKKCSKCYNIDSQLAELTHDHLIPSELRNATVELLEQEFRYLKNRRIMSILNQHNMERLDLKEIFSRIYKVEIEKHRQTLIAKCPRVLQGLSKELQTMDNVQIVYITRADIDVFDHLTSMPCFKVYQHFFEYMTAQFIRCINGISINSSPSSVIPVMAPVIGFLFKSFSEIVLEIIETTGTHKLEDMLKYESDSWKLEENIKWPESTNDEAQSRGLLSKFFRSSKNKSSLHNRSLEFQYKIIFQMMKHFLPGRCFKRSNLNFNVLEQDLSFWEKGWKFVGKNVGLAKRLKDLPDERLVWLYILDYTLYNVFKDESENHVLMKAYNTLLQGHVSFIEKSPTESHESFRVLTHSVIKFVTSTAPYFRETRENPGVDVEILVHQMWTFSSAFQNMDENPQTFSQFRDLIEEFNRYLSLRLFLDTGCSPGYLSSQVSEIMQTFMEIVKTSLEKKSVPNTTMVKYFRSLNDFLDDFKNIDFPVVWYVKSFFHDPESMEKVDNKLASTGHCSYLVTDIDKYVQQFHSLRHQPPNHYIIQVVLELLQCIEGCLGKKWPSNNDQELQVAQLESTGVMFNAVRRSFLYLKEQPDYVDFEAFKKESIGPFMRLCECSSLDDLRKRAEIVKESFWYIRKMDEIGIDQALALLQRANSVPLKTDILLSCYNLYISRYEDYIAKYSTVLSEGKSHNEGMDAVVEMLPESKPVHFSKWTDEFKVQEIPVLLAGLSAVWSILASKDVSTSGKFLKPHCIQILCVMRLLSVDRDDSVNNHLAQVLTGQGKSVILGLLSSLLALTGHKVRVLCYSKYLSSRDQDDFEEFFDIFQVANQIRYGTFEDMAADFLRPTCNGTRTDLFSLVKNRVLKHTKWSSRGKVTSETQETVLLIDEVDVFFSKKFYGVTSGWVETITIRGLSAVQELIWDLANSRHTEEQILQNIETFIAEGVTAGDSQLVNLKDFLGKSRSFPLLEEDGDHLCVKTYTNKSLFDEHLLSMVQDALRVVYSPDDSWVRNYFKLNTAEQICCRDRFNIYGHSFSGYLNTFNYFRLKKSDYDTKNGTNYGYLLVWVGNISYARIPSQFQLILGVSGTISNLGDYEKHGVESYNIRDSSVLPSFFGESNLKFDERENFLYLRTVQEWLKNVNDRVNQVLQSRRAVLVFFESETTMGLFSKEYKVKFDRLNELTPNTEPELRDVFINEAGLPCTVTLATRDMGRGVDYKSSLSVEKNGGVHVIQTFFSTDVKEEIQIKGRTARQDNKGSYEMIICREHLIKAKIIPKEDNLTHSYSSLDRIRRELSVKEGRTITEKLEKCEQDHITTMEYFGLV